MSHHSIPLVTSRTRILLVTVAVIALIVSPLSPSTAASAATEVDLLTGTWSHPNGFEVAFTTSNAVVTDSPYSCILAGQRLMSGIGGKWRKYTATVHYPECHEPRPTDIALSASANTLSMGYDGGYVLYRETEGPGCEREDATWQKVFQAVDWAEDTGLWTAEEMDMIKSDPCRWLDQPLTIVGGGDGQVTPSPHKTGDKEFCGSWNNEDEPAELYVSDWPKATLIGSVVFSQTEFCTNGSHVYAGCVETDKKKCGPPPDPVAQVQFMDWSIAGFVTVADCSKKAGSTAQGGRYIFTMQCKTAWSPAGLFDISGGELQSNYIITDQPNQWSAPDVTVEGPFFGTPF